MIGLKLRNNFIIIFFLLFAIPIYSAEKILSLGAIAHQSAKELNSPVMLILAFYFAAPHMSGIAKAVTDKFKAKV